MCRYIGIRHIKNIKARCCAVFKIDDDRVIIKIFDRIIFIVKLEEFMIAITRLGIDLIQYRLRSRDENNAYKHTKSKDFFHFLRVELNNIVNLLNQLKMRSDSRRSFEKSISTDFSERLLPAYFVILLYKTTIRLL